MAIIKPVDESKIFIQQLDHFAPASQNIKVSMLRLDAIHPLISGNKWYKLKYNIEEAIAQDKNCILTFGGAFSNHLIAVAAAAHNAGLSSIGMVRGEEKENQVLAACKAYGMNLHFISREDYAKKIEPAFVSKLSLSFPDAFFIPEGGANIAGQTGAALIAPYIPSSYSHVLLSVGTGTTFIGLRNALPPNQKLIGFAPMKGGIYLKAIIDESLAIQQNKNWCLTDRFHFGGFGKLNQEVIEFMASFQQQYQFDLDRVYTAKMMLGLKQLLSENIFPQNADILCIHTGGLTGN